MKHAFLDGDVSRDALASWYREARARTQQLFELFVDDAYYERPIPLRNPLVFYEGHLPAFSVNTLLKLAQKKPGIDETLEVLFARGIDPEDEAAVPGASSPWPSRDEVRAYGAAADEAILQAIATGPLLSDEVPALRRGEAVFTIIEHELMHQETLLYMIHALPSGMKVRRAPLLQVTRPPRRVDDDRATARVPAGTATLGADRDTHFGWDNEFTRHRVD
ncbi:MAG: DinB family protein, partial [Thermoanaerobaculia bacterium]